MAEEETEPGRGRSSHRPDPAFIDRLANDEEWRDYGSSRGERRVDRHKQGRRRAATKARPGRSRKGGPRRLPAVIVLVVVAVAIGVVGFEAGASELDGSRAGESSPFYMLPLDWDAVTSTVSTVPPTTAPSSSTSTSGSTTPETPATSQ